eukprot:6891927-Alexandrium_andersonii.AAC.1
MPALAKPEQQHTGHSMLLRFARVSWLNLPLFRAGARRMASGPLSVHFDAQQLSERISNCSVSYTHLTLPTICSV